MRALVVGVGLYGGDVGVHKHHLDALLLQRLDRLFVVASEDVTATSTAERRREGRGGERGGEAGVKLHTQE